MDLLETDIDLKVQKKFRQFNEMYLLLRDQLQTVKDERKKFPLIFLAKNSDIKEYIKEQITKENKTKEIAKKRKLEVQKKINKLKEEEVINADRILTHEVELVILDKKIKRNKTFFVLNENRVRYFHDDLLLYITGLYDEVIDIIERIEGASYSINLDVADFESQYLLEFADQYLKSKNYSNATESLRKSYLALKSDLKNLKKLANSFKNMANNADRVLKRLNNDEINQRRFHEKVNNKLGLM